MNSSQGDQPVSIPTPCGMAPRAARLKHLLEDVAARLSTGESVNVRQILDEHQDLMPELGEELRLYEGICSAGRRAAATDGSDLPDFSADAWSDEEFQFLRGALEGYEVLGKLRYGGQGAVCRAKQRATGRTVALKVLLDGPLASPRQRRRFEREIELVARLRHPHVVTVYESGVVFGRPYFTMEYVEGDSIEAYAGRHALSTRARVRLMAAVCRGVGHAHQKGVIHRDLKPANILVDAEGAPRVLDFGLAKLLDAEEADAERTKLSLTGQVMGTLPYLSPEQAGGEHDEVDVRSDVYSLGVVLYRLLTGAFPYPVTGTHRQVCAAIRMREAKPLRDVPAAEPLPSGVELGDFDPDLNSVVMKALEKDPKRRYQACADFEADLDRWLSGEPVAAQGGRAWYLFKKMVRRHRTRFVAATMALLIVGGLGGQILRLTEDNRVAAATRRQLWWSSRGNSFKLLQAAEQKRAREFHEAQADSMPAAAAEAFRSRYRCDPARAPAELAEIAASVPSQLLSDIRSGDAAVRGNAVAWLQTSDEVLARLSDMVVAQAIELSVHAAGMDDALGWLAGENSVRAIEAYVARAHLASSQGDFNAALDDLRTATLLALDLGDSFALFQQLPSLLSRRLIYGCLLESVGAALDRGDDVSALPAWMAADPPITPLTGAWQKVRQHQALRASAWFVADAEGGPEHIDLDQLEATYAPGFSILALMSPEARSTVGGSTREEILRPAEAFIADALEFDDLTYDVLADRCAQYESGIDARSSREPILYSLPRGIVGGYSLRLKVCSLRQATVLLGRIVQYRRIVGTWPASLNDVLNADPYSDALDPVTGRPYEYLIPNGLPRLRSAWPDGVYRPTEVGEAPWIEAGRATFFPAPIEDLSESRTIQASW